MNIVKGVADLLRRSSGGVQTGDGSSWTRAEKLSAPSFKILFEEVGEESELRALWQSYDSIINKTEKRKSLQTFLTRFIQIYENWEPVHNDQLPVDLSTLYTTSEHASGLKNVVIGCSFGHPSEIILILVQEIARMTSLISELNVISSSTSPEFSESSLSSTFDAEAFDILNSLTIITRSMHNCRVFSYYGGVQKVTALIKAVVIQLKTLISAQAIDNDFSGLNAVKIELLEKILLYVVSIILSFIDLNPDFHEKIHFIITSKCCIPEDRPFQKSLHIYKGQVSEARIHWQRKAIILVMESGGVNWLVELLRIVKKLNLEDQWIRWSLQYLILNSLRCILFQNARAQNHFRSIGGLEVLLDGLSLPSSNYLALSSSFVSKTRRGEDHLIATFQLQILSLEVLKESIFGNLTNLQFLCENGRVQKFANCICSSVFMLQEYRMSLPKPDSDMAISSSKIETFQETSSTSPVIFSNCGFGSDWTEYCIQLSQSFCSFLLSNEDDNIHNVETSVAHSSIPVTFAYWELSIKWFLKVLVAIFPCIKAFSSENELPVHSRILANSLQHCTLNTLRKFLTSAPRLLEVFREEGIWNFIFSEKFFYFWPVLEGWSTKNDINRKDFAKLCEFSSNSTYLKDQLNYNEAIIPQMEIISFLEFAATLGGSAHNLPECSILLDTLEQSAYNPILSIVLLKSLHRILQLSVEQTVTSFKEVDAIGRVLKVSCIQAQEHKKLGSLCIKTQKQCTSEFELLEHQISCSTETGTEWVECMEVSMELFSAYLSFSENAKGLVLHSTTCIDCLFDLFWEEHLRSQVLDHVLGLMKLPPSSPEDQAAMLLLCSKYLETFTHAKEKGNGYTEISIDLLIGMRDVLVLDQKYYQALFREGECFLHIVSLLNDTPDEKLGEPLVSNVLQTLTFLLVDNDVSKSAFRALAGAGYQTLQSLLLDFCQSRPSLALLNALLDMLVDGKFNNVDPPLIKNEDVIMLFLAILKKSSDSLRHYGLDILESFVKDSITNRTICFKSGALGFLLDWFPVEENDNILSKLAHLVWTIGGHSISGKDIRKIFALLCSEKIGSSQKYCSLLLICIHSMLMEKGPTAFFELSGHNSGIEIKTPLQWPNSKGFSFSCWIRIESLPETGLMSLFLFCSDNGKGSLAMLGKGKLVFESIGQKRQSVSLSLNLLPKRWHCLCITHSIGRAFSGGSLLRCYVDGDLVSSEKCRYAKIPDALTRCLIGSKIKLFTEQIAEMSPDECLPFFGQIGPVYLFGDALSPEQVKGIYFLGPSYMYSFVGNEVLHISENSLTNMLLDIKDGLSSKVIFGLNAQASDGRILFNVSSTAESMSDKNQFEALVLDGTRLCSRRIFKEIIYCVGGVSVFFPLLSQLGSDNLPSPEEDDFTLIRSMMSDKLSGEVIELVTSVLDENLANQQQMHLLSGFPILGFLFQSITPELLNMKTLSSLKHLLHVIRSGGLSELLLKDAISWIYLNPRIWMYADYEVQRELYMFLIQHFENDVIHLTTLCQLPRIIDIICEFYWDIPDSPLAFGTTSLLHPVTRQVIAERPTAEEVRKIRLLLLSLAEMSLKQKIEKSDVKALIAFFERSHDMVCIEDVLQMVMRALSQNVLLASFLEQVNLLGGCHVFINLLQRELEPIRLLGLQFLGKLLVGLPSGKKGQKIFNLSVGRSKSLSENSKKNRLMRLQPIILAIADRLFRFPLSDHLCASLFDTLLGGASPKQILQKNAVRNRNKSSSSENCSHFLLPQFLVLIFNFLERCKDTSSQEKMLKDLLDLLDSNPTNIEALVENCWLSWLETSVRLDILTNCEEAQSEGQAFASKHGHYLVRNVYCMVLSHYIYSVRGGWQRLEEAINFILVQTEKIKNKCCLVRNIFQDLVGSLLNVSSEENVFSSQPCRDNTLYLLKLTDEMLSGEIDEEVLFPYCALYADFPLDPSQSEDQKDIQCSLQKILNEKDPEQLSSATWSSKPREIANDEEWWSLYDSIWVLICEMNGKGPTSKILSKASGLTGPSFGQRARGLVESLNIPAAEMAAAVVSGGIGSALSGKATKPVDKAMLLRGEKCPRIVFRLLMLYICRATLDRASKCAQQFISLLPCLLTSDDEQNKNKLHHYIWYLLLVKSQCEIHDDSSRLQIVSHLVLELVNYGKPMLATVLGKDNPSDCGRLVMEYGSICNLIQKDRILMAANDEAKYLKASKHDRSKQLQELRVRTNEISVEQSSQKMLLEDETQSNVNMILASDDNRKAAHRLAYDENQQTVAEKWIHLFRTLIDERGPWSAAAFPNNVMVHWKHDKTEDICRRRPKLRKNYQFNAELCRPPTSTSSRDGSSDVNDGYSGNMNFPEKMKHLLLKGVRGIADELASDLCEDVNDPVGIKTFDLNCRLDNQFSSHLEYKDQAGNHQERKSLASSNADTDSSEVLLHIPCVLVTLKRKVAGHLSVMQSVLHFSGDFLVEGTGGSSIFKRFDVLQNSEFDQIRGKNKHKMHDEPLNLYRSGKGGPDNIHVTISQRKWKKIKRHRRWNITKVKAVHLIRYLLQYTAIEIFFSNSVAPVFLNFASTKDAKKAGDLVVSARNEALLPKGMSRDKSGVISFVDQRAAVEQAEIARESWRRREISNFEYLIILNTLAGRTYNDLTQYPVFPWVLADYTSEKLDFNKSSTFRDLSKPVGALDSKRFEVFEERYRNFCDPDIPSFYYGSHYSSMGIVLFYLLRLEPFTALHRNLQGGKFDHADRLFQSIEGTYNNCLSNTSDVKELIPEFFYMPEFLVNMNSYHLGVKQDGEPLADVSLPPWAKGSPEEFIYRNREALESEYVSSNLHHWIDLIFGYKQRGKPAIEAANVFYHLTYEGAVDLEVLDDELQRSAIEDQIANFGQTPIQIFRKKHPRRGPPIPIAHPLYFAPASISLTSVVSNTARPPSSILFIDLLDSNIVIVNQDLTLTVKTWLTTQLQSGGNFTFSSSQEPSFGIGFDILPSRKIGTPLAEHVELNGQCFATLQTTNENYLISCGSWDNSFRLISLSDGRVVQSIRQHKDVVSCIAVTSDGSVLATGSYDTTVMVWDSRLRNMEKRVRSAQIDVFSKDLVIIENPCHILSGHDDIITCLFASVELDIIISGSKDGTCMFHTLREGRYVRSIQHPSGTPLSKLIVSQHGRVVVYAENDLSLHMFSINGKYLAFSECNGRLNCIKLSSCGDFLVSAGDHGHIILRSMHSLDVVRRYEGIGKAIASLTVTPEECFLAGTKDGTLLVYSIENPHLRRSTVSQIRS